MSKAKPDLEMRLWTSTLVWPRETTESGEKRDALSRDRELHLVIMAFETENKHTSRWAARQIEKELFLRQSRKVETPVFDIQATMDSSFSRNRNVDIELCCAPQQNFAQIERQIYYANSTFDLPIWSCDGNALGPELATNKERKKARALKSGSEAEKRRKKEGNKVTHGLLWAKFFQMLQQ